MNLLDRLIGYVVMRLPSRRGPSLAEVDGGGLLITTEAVEHLRSWEEVNRVTAANIAGLVGETALVAIEFTDGATLIVPETDKRWNALTKALSALPGAQSSTEWQLLLLTTPDKTLEIYRQG